MHQTTQTIKLI